TGRLRLRNCATWSALDIPRSCVARRAVSTRTIVPAMGLPFRFSDLAVGVPSRPLERRDPEFIRGELPRLGWLYDHYNEIVVEGLSNLPPRRALIVGNHNGGLMAPDMFALMVAHWRAHGVEAPAYGLMHDLPFYAPLVG